jgi:hypothetical protein
MQTGGILPSIMNGGRAGKKLLPFEERVKTEKYAYLEDFLLRTQGGR